MKEYCIYIRQNSGQPYMLRPYTNMFEVRKALNEIVSLEEERGRPYFVDNDFFDNKYCNISSLKYLCVKEREVSEWETYSEEKAINKAMNESKKIIYINNFKI